MKETHAKVMKCSGLRKQSEAFNNKPAGKVLPSGKVIDLASFLDMPGTGG